MNLLNKYLYLAMVLFFLIACDSQVANSEFANISSSSFYGSNLSSEESYYNIILPPSTIIDSNFAENIWYTALNSFDSTSDIVYEDGWFYNDADESLSNSVITIVIPEDGALYFDFWQRCSYPNVLKVSVDGIVIFINGNNKYATFEKSVYKNDKIVISIANISPTESMPDGRFYIQNIYLKKDIVSLD